MPAQNFNKAHLREFRAARWVRALVALLVLGTLSWGGWEFQRRLDGQWTGPGDWWGIRATKSNYSEEALKWAEAFDLPYPYLMALIQLETGGRKPAGKRFESHVFDQLQAVRDGSRLSYENVTAAHLADASDEALRNLATSWGSFPAHGVQVHLARSPNPGHPRQRSHSVWRGLDQPNLWQLPQTRGLSRCFPFAQYRKAFP